MNSATTPRRRVNNTTVACPIIYGSLAFYLGKKADQYATHRWTLYLRSPNGEDLSSFIQKVAFTLHPSFAEPVREVLAPPYEVTETGWGEFEAGIRIFFRDPDEQPIDLFHLIKLYPDGLQQPLNSKKPVVAEFYDEIIFTDPLEKFYSMLMMYTPEGGGKRADANSSVAKVESQFAEFFPVFDDGPDLESLTSIHDHILREIEVAKSKLIDLESTTIDLQHKAFTQQQLLQAQQQAQALQAQQQALAQQQQQQLHQQQSMAQPSMAQPSQVPVTQPVVVHQSQQQQQVPMQVEIQTQSHQMQVVPEPSSIV